MLGWSIALLLHVVLSPIWFRPPPLITLFPYAGKLKPVQQSPAAPVLLWNSSDAKEEDAPALQSIGSQIFTNWEALKLQHSATASAKDLQLNRALPVSAPIIQSTESHNSVDWCSVVQPVPIQPLSF
uniref:Uncharacterized protein n=1 Tax=Ditylenchus dipsaci TaxID=166011 RepID=A0A915D830_9BILA